MKGIILAGGNATRLYPATVTVCKQLLPVYDKPLIYYPLSVLMLAGIREILIISTPEGLPGFRALFGDGRSLGLHFEYAEQKNPKGIAEGLIIGSEFVGKDNFCLILGDNIFYGHDLASILKESVIESKNKAIVFGYFVQDPKRYGVIEFDAAGRIKGIEEKPAKPKSNWVITGLYFYDNEAIKFAKKLKPSKRGELEITEINKSYLEKGKLKLRLLGRGFAWLDAGTPEALLDASIFIKTIEERQGLKIGCIEEVAYRMGYINKEKLKKIADSLKSPYGRYLKGLSMK